MAGTPVKSCKSTRAGLKAISVSGVARGFQVARQRISSSVTAWPSSVLLYTYDEAGGFFDHVPPPETCVARLQDGRFHELGTRVPLMLAGVAVLTGAIGIARYLNNQRRCFFAMAAMMVVFFHAARLAMIAFDPYLSSKPLADALASAPPGKLIEADAYYAFSSVFFYTNRQALLWNGRRENLEYGSYAPTAPHVFIGDRDFRELWLSDDRYYLLADHEDLPYLQELVGAPALHIVSESGGKYLLTNRRS